MTEMKRKPLKLSKKRWRSRWLVLPSWRALHRVAVAEWENVADYSGSYIEATGTTLCGKSGALRVPGILSRMGLPRCKECCRLLGLPNGDGAPFNDKKLKPAQQDA